MTRRFLNFFFSSVSQSVLVSSYASIVSLKTDMNQIIDYFLSIIVRKKLSVTVS